MKKFEFNKINDGFYSIEQDGVRSFMFVGDYILLVDSGRGGSNLLNQVKEFSDLPIKIIYTHADGDHTGDAKDFENRFMHPCEFDYYYSKTDKPVLMNPIWESEAIEVGDYKFEVILIPGHTPGSIALLDRDNRIMIGGDSLQSGPIYMFGPGRNFSAFRASMIKMQALLEYIDWIYSSHHQLKIKPTIVNQLLDGAQKMIAGVLVGKPEDRFNGEVKLYKADGVSFYAK